MPILAGSSRKRRVDDASSGDDGGATDVVVTNEQPAEGAICERDEGSAHRRGDDDASPSAAATDRATASDHIDALRRLEEEYRHLDHMETIIAKCLSRLRDEEASLRLAHEQSSTSLKEQREMISKRKEDEAVARLEEALMMDGGCSDDSDSDSGMPVSETF
jgi:hypothetical protein